MSGPLEECGLPCLDKWRGRHAGNTYSDRGFSLGVLHTFTAAMRFWLRCSGNWDMASTAMLSSCSTPRASKSAFRRFGTVARKSHARLALSIELPEGVTPAKARTAVLRTLGTSPEEVLRVAIADSVSERYPARLSRR